MLAVDSFHASRRKDPESLRRSALDGRTPAHWAALSGQARRHDQPASQVPTVPMMLPMPLVKVAVLELLSSLVPDTLTATARNGATPAHDAAFQGPLHKRAEQDKDAELDIPPVRSE